MRVFAGAISAETNVFSPIVTDLESFRTQLYIPAGGLLDNVAVWPAPMQGFREVCAEQGWTLAAGLCASAPPGGLVPADTFRSLLDTLLADLAAAMPVDMVALSLHGAMSAAGCDDCDGEILASVRELVGPDVPVGAVLDPHAHLTDRMVAMADLLVFFKEYPHTDVIPSAREMLNLLGRRTAGTIRPVASVFDCRMLTFFFTDREPMKGFVQRMRALEGRDGILSISLVHGFPWGDNADIGAKMLVYADGDAGAAACVAADLGRALFDLRGDTMPETAGLDDIAARIRDVRDRPVVLADVSDNPGGGAPGDATFLLQALLEAGLDDLVIGPVWDPYVVAQAFGLGEGAQSRIRIGGKVSPFSGPPLDLDVRVERLRRGAVQEVDGWPWPLGDMALLSAGRTRIVVASLRTQCINTDVFTQVGVDPAVCPIVVVKSAQHFLAAFAPFAAAVLYVRTPAALSLDGDPGRYRHLRRPLWPFVADPFQ
ncbi:M81 family metallopeptidase [Niveispirillum sp.]|uniref:M81 family metallopeptidase n=1 Tax=Niveispirillum sp. TaxID=1917217 RepID=UPI001B3F8308|nr:M81 family metallopeptidase [Niveispirillum sp.]MBP7337163.1 M81 family metallopeptidase [Niveispirillum sp.]